MRIKHLMFCILSAAPALAANEPSRVPSDRLVVIFFGSATCGECLEIKARILQPLQKKHPDRIELRTYETEDETAFDLLIKLEELYGEYRPGAVVNDMSGDVNPCDAVTNMRAFVMSTCFLYTVTSPSDVVAVVGSGRYGDSPSHNRHWAVGANASKRLRAQANDT